MKSLDAKLGQFHSEVIPELSGAMGLLAGCILDRVPLSYSPAITRAQYLAVPNGSSTSGVGNSGVPGCSSMAGAGPGTSINPPGIIPPSDSPSIIPAGSSGSNSGSEGGFPANGTSEPTKDVGSSSSQCESVAHSGSSTNSPSSPVGSSGEHEPGEGGDSSVPLHSFEQREEVVCSLASGSSGPGTGNEVIKTPTRRRTRSPVPFQTVTRSASTAAAAHAATAPPAPSLDLLGVPSSTSEAATALQSLSSQEDSHGESSNPRIIRVVFNGTRLPTRRPSPPVHQLPRGSNAPLRFPMQEPPTSNHCGRRGPRPSSCMRCYVLRKRCVVPIVGGACSLCLTAQVPCTARPRVRRRGSQGGGPVQ